MVVEDELIVARDIAKTVERNGYKVIGIARTAEKALGLITEHRPDLVLLDIFLNGPMTGIDLAHRLNDLGIAFIYISANSNQQVLTAAKATNPYGFIVKPFREKDVVVAMEIAKYRFDNRAISQAHTTSEKRIFPSRSSSGLKGSYSNIVGQSAPMLKVFQLVDQVAPYDSSVLLLGETGTGKEGIARCIYEKSCRKNKPFIKINCAALPESLIESELFGYEKGAFTGAFTARAGKFEQAANGTMLLDEIGEMPLDMQSKLLRVLQEKEVQRIGSSATIKTDVRIIAATSRNLEKEVAEGRFRLDLYYRLHVFPIELPPLREREKDIILLAQYFIKDYAQKTGKQVYFMSDKSLQLLSNYSWPGNVRELQHLMERAVIMTNDETIDHEFIADFILSKKTAQPLTVTGEKEALIAALEQCRYKISGMGGAAELLHITPASMLGKLKKHGIRITYSS